MFQLGQIPEQFQRFGIGQCLPIADLFPHHHLAHRQLDDLAVGGAGNIRHLQDHRRHMAWRGIAADLLPDFPPQGIVQLKPLAQTHKEHHPHVTLPGLTDAEAFQYLVELFHLTVDFGSAYAYASWVEDSIGTAVDNQTLMGRYLSIVAVGPDVGKTTEIGVIKALPLGIVPEADRHAGKGTGADQLPLLPAQGCP